MTFGAGGSITLAGHSDYQPANLAPSAGMLSIDQYGGDITMTARVSSYELLQKAYQAYLSLFMAGGNYQLQDYRLWSQTDAIDGSQLAWVRVKTYDGIDATWGNSYSSVGPKYEATEPSVGKRMDAVSGVRFWIGGDLPAGGNAVAWPGPPTYCGHVAPWCMAAM